MNLPVATPLAQWREAAHASLQRGELQQAAALFQRILEQLPDDVEALQVLGTAQLAAGDFSAAAQTLQQALQRAPELFVERLRLGVALERLDRPQDALTAYFGALRTAQNQGRWLGDDTTAPGLRDAVKHSMRYVDAGRPAWFRQVLEPLQQRYGVAQMRRVADCLASYLGERPVATPDPRQRPKFLYFPGLPSQPYYPRERFPWHAELEAATASIRQELQAVLAQRDSLEAFLDAPPPGQMQQAMLQSSGPQPAAWDAYFFYRHGERYDAHAAACPRTAALLDGLPLTRIPGHAPETLFSVLTPGTHILPHTGVTNLRLVTHLPLLVPADCALCVGGELHAWREGHCVTFDDTFEHEAWNRSAETRVVLILDSWNPDLTDAERVAVTELIEAIGQFNRASGA
ncbi:aspartyl/asparaginyl beta-hydroxylase domain-containing protein [Dyella acidiphila]|uniref:Aspartyl/asparaginyl beta-hydroxylase domain-containing protein n=1 Tax=Dyella acidiphila TaxID=2775866 RepID=A0ABR9G5J4_9GAMM|nr:aspartyl/asparaginyl beta-hydroxylase domain-containing protein [Dyella acidiphila]MBE1159283.1 aspartyl/asparaginyl beta-hydroxylase domain-containing protein [Dyella acidiphila]